jgi:2-hydroxyglutaryl-CoA dehydratase, D-component
MTVSGATMNGGNTFTQLVDGLRRDPQAAARAAAASGQRVVGYVGNDVPVELILAAGALPVRLRCAPGNDTSVVDGFIESSFDPELRAVASQWLRGELDHLEAVVFSRGDDSGQRIYYYLCELQRRGVCAGPRPLLYDVAGLPRDSSGAHTLESTRLLATELGVSNGSLPAAIERARQRDELLAAVRARRLLPAPIAGSAAWACELAASCDWRASFDDAARRWLDAAPLLPMPRRVMLAGDPPPDDQLHTAVEAAGGSVVLELTGSRPSGQRGLRDPLAAIAAEYRGRESTALSMRRDPRWLADAALDHRADAVIVWLSEQDEALPWEIPRQLNALRAAHIPVLSLERQPWSVSAAVLTQVMHFARTAGVSE